MAAIHHLVEDVLTDDLIAAHPNVQVSKRQLEYWKDIRKWPEFDAAYHAAFADWEARQRSRHWASKTRRLVMLQAQLDEAITHKASLLDLKEARAVEYGAQARPVVGGQTGNMVRSSRPVMGEDGQMRALYTDEFDRSLSAEIRGTSAEIRALSDQIAGEMGQKIDKIEHSGSIDLTGLMKEALARRD